MTQNGLEICFSPAIFEAHSDSEAVVVIVDILRATSSICTAFANGVREIIPVATVEEAREMKSKGYLLAAERDGYVLDFADFGNSPFNFTPEKVGGKVVAYSTTNGTGIMKMASECHDVVIGSYLNFSALCRWLEEQNRKVIIVCAGWKKRFSLEDALCAGAIAAQTPGEREIYNHLRCSACCHRFMENGRGRPYGLYRKSCPEVKTERQGPG